jgi:quinol monooxygenase YgiN
MCTSPRYEIRVRGPLGPTALEAFPTLESRRRGSDTVLTGPVADQAALLGVLHSNESLGLELLALHVCGERIASPHQTQTMEGALMKNVTHGFHATMTAQPGKGDALVELFLNAASGAGPGASEDCVVFLVGRSATDSDVVYVTEGWTSKEAHSRNRWRQRFGFHADERRGHRRAALLLPPRNERDLARGPDARLGRAPSAWSGRARTIAIATQAGAADRPIERLVLRAERLSLGTRAEKLAIGGGRVWERAFRWPSPTGSSRSGTHRQECLTPMESPTIRDYLRWTARLTGRSKSLLIRYFSTSHGDIPPRAGGSHPGGRGFESP